MKFCGNISTLCRDIPHLKDRVIHLLSKSDYKLTAFECQDPYSIPISEWKSLMDSNPFQFILINSPPIFSHPLIKSAPALTIPLFQQHCLQPAIDYATALDIKKIHLVMQQDVSIEDMKPYLEFASKETEPKGITCLIEPLCHLPNYYLRSYHDAINLVKQLNRPNLKVMLDTFHLQMLHGNLTENIKLTLPFTGHVQVSQAPNRDSPMKGGEINFPYVMKQINQGYHDFVGLEYFADSIEPVSWVKVYEDI